MSGIAARLPLILNELRLPTVKRLWAALAAQSNKEGWPAERFLAAVMEHELAERETRRLERHRLESQLLPGKLLSNFDFATVPTVSKAHVTALVDGDGWLEQGANLLLFGPPGVGKSHLVCAIGYGLIDRGYRVHFTRTSDLVQKLQIARREMRLPAEIARLDRFDLLILDDLSYVRRDQAETSVLFELIAARYERKSLALTANQPFSGWDQVFPEPAITLAAVDRLVHHSTIFELNVESYRRRAAATASTTPQPRRKKD
jgi:DNA replication protein DnaC